MADIGQATFTDGHIKIKCDGKWTCCQRQQAAAKVRAMNKELPKKIRATCTDLTARKSACQAAARDAMDAATPAENAKANRDADGAPCITKALEEGKTRSELGLQMDHPLDVKLGGAPDGVTLMPLDGAVNRFFGGVAKNAGDEMRDQSKFTCESISLICPPSEGCPNPPGDPDGVKHDEGPHSEYPENPSWITPQRALVA